ncbi:MAG: hypothetical protein GF398_16815 [Chitinivibrionales bacterium]|nr:hypothetical protein [Chitinivibrionales bacterium]
MYRFPGEVDDLNLPDFHESHDHPPAMSMDQYERWVDEMLRDAVTQEARIQALNRKPVPHPFRIYDTLNTHNWR